MVGTKRINRSPKWLNLTRQTIESFKDPNYTTMFFQVIAPLLMVNSQFRHWFSWEHWIYLDPFDSEKSCCFMAMGIGITFSPPWKMVHLWYWWMISLDLPEKKKEWWLSMAIFSNHASTCVREAPPLPTTLSQGFNAGMGLSGPSAIIPKSTIKLFKGCPGMYIKNINTYLDIHLSRLLRNTFGVPHGLILGNHLCINIH